MERKIPASYQEWMDCMKHLETQVVQKEDLFMLEKGSIPAGGYIADKFQTHVVHTVDAMLKRYVRRFNHSLKVSMESGDFESIPFLCQRLQKEVEYCFFFRHILFLEKTFASDLEREVKKQIFLFWNNTLHEMERIYKESNHRQLEDVIYTLKRMYKSSGD